MLVLSKQRVDIIVRKRLTLENKYLQLLIESSVSHYDILKKLYLLARTVSVASVAL